MVKKMLALLCALVLFMPVACAEKIITPAENTEYYPDADEWTYCYRYRVPVLETGMTDLGAMMINETLQMALDEMRELVLPMFASSGDMTQYGPVTICQDYVITCNNDRFFSLLITREEQDDRGSFYTIESEVFDVGGEYLGETLTLRGVVMVGESSDQLGRAVLPVLYERFVQLQKDGICDPSVTEKSFYQLCSPTLDYYADEEGNAVFFLQPSLMREPSLEVPTFTFTPDELAELCENVPAVEAE